MHALTLACLRCIKEILMTASTQHWSQCRMRMIRILLSDKASQTLMLKCVVCMDKMIHAHEINSHEINSHEVNSHQINFP